MARPNKALRDDMIDNRRRHVAAMRLRGFTIREIVDGLKEMREHNPETGEPWGHGTVQRDLDALEKTWKAEAAHDIAYYKALTNARLEEVIRLSFREKDTTNVLAAIKQQRELLGLDAPKQTQIGGIPDGAPVQISHNTLLEGINLADFNLQELDVLEAAFDLLESRKSPSGAPAAPPRPPMM